jgi:hypothetical protein
MYKKLLLATAVAAIAGQASAASWVTTNFGDQVAVKHTAEGIDKSTEADGVATSGAILSVGAQLAQNDTVTFTYNIAKATNYNWPTSLYSRKPGSTPDVTVLVDETVSANDGVIDVDVGGTDDASNFAVGDICNFAGSAVDHRVTAVDLSGETITITPHPGATTDNTAITCSDPSFVAMGLINSTDTSVTYRVTSVTEGPSTVGTEIAVPSPNVSVAALKTAKSVTVAYSAATSSGVAMDTLATTASLGTVIDEIKYAVTTPFDGLIDVENDKKDFASGMVTSNDDADSVVLTTTVTAGTEGDKHTIASTGVVTLAAAVNDVMTSANSAVTTISGDFTYLDNDLATAGVTATGATQSNVDAVAVAADGLSITATDSAVANATAVTVVVDNSESVALDAQAFTGSTVVTYTSNGDATATKTVDHGSLGSWTLNGASVTA